MSCVCIAALVTPHLCPYRLDLEIGTTGRHSTRRVVLYDVLPTIPIPPKSDLALFESTLLLVIISEAQDPSRSFTTLVCSQHVSGYAGVGGDARKGGSPYPNLQGRRATARIALAGLRNRYHYMAYWAAMRI